MCQSDHIMRLCTCNEENIDKDFMWLLYAHQYKEKICIGRYLPGDPEPLRIFSKEVLIGLLRWVLSLVLSLFCSRNLKFKKNRKVDISKRIFRRNHRFPRSVLKMQNDLNEYSVFDFEYEPKYEDILVICLKGQQYTFMRSIGVTDKKICQVWRIVDFQNYIDVRFLCDLEAYLSDKINTRVAAGVYEDGAIDVKKGEIQIG